MSTSKIAIPLFLLLAFSYVVARKVFVVAPNTLRLDAEETVVITVSESAEEREIYSLYLEEHPTRKNRFSEQTVVVHHGVSSIAKVKVTPKDLQDIKDDGKEPRYVYVVVTGNGITKEIKLHVSSQSGHVFIQTDKPIYTPQQTVNVRIIPLNEHLLPKHGKIHLHIRNPQDVIVQEKIFEPQWDNSQPLFPVYNYKFPPHPMLGVWSVVVLYGHEFQMNSSVQFEVDEYVLPNFVVTIDVPNVILPGEENVEVYASAKYVYGKEVKGTALFKLGVKHKLGNVIEFGRSRTKLLQNGKASLMFSANEITNNDQIAAFPFDSKLFVEVDIVDTATGLREKAINEECTFANSPYIISFKRSQRDFKPGLVSVIMADVTYTNGKPAEGVPTSISVVDDKGRLIQVTNPMYTSDKDGHVYYTVNTPIGSSLYTVTIKTNDPRYKETQQFSGTHQLSEFKASGGYVAISRLEGTRVLEVSSLFSSTVVIQPFKEIHDVFYLVLSRGRIVKAGSLSRDMLLHRELQFQVTAEMAPSLRIVVFGLFRNELIADAIQVEVEHKCEQQAEVKIETQFHDTVPGGEGSFLLKGHPETRVGILAVDSAVYALRDKDRLTREKLFKTLEKDDLGCGPGGGVNTELVLANAGVVIFGNFKYVIKENSGCAQQLRRKREIVDTVVNEHPIESRKCCRLGLLPDKYHRSCEERAEIVRNFTSESDDGNCTNAYLSCCQRINSDGIIDFRGRQGGDIDILEFVDDLDVEEKQALTRKDFRETWLFQDLWIGVDGTEKMSTSLPHSITTWVVQAVSVSNQFGMCVSEPKELVSFKKIFIHLNLPYAVVQNEQIEIQATIFNYNPQTVPVVVYMYGVEDLCTGVQANEKSERRKVHIEGHSTITVGFAVVPLKVKEYNIRVVALSQIGHDVIEKRLRVVAKGMLFEETIPLVLDPTNQKRRRERDVITETVTDSIDASQQLQLTAVKLRPSKDYIPGTESCIISAIGDEFGPTVETAVHNPETLVRLPIGCGEQTMMFMGPTVYTLNYLKVKGKLTPEFEGKAYGFVREGYNRELTFRKEDGSYAAFVGRAASTWLTAFVMKVFCQSSKYIFIDPNVICTGLKWLIQQQNADGSFTEKHPVIHWDMVGGLKGAVPMTAFVLISLHHCTCEIEELHLSKIRALLYLEGALPDINDEYALSVVSYALALSDSKLKEVANEKLRNAAIFNEALNQRHWSKGSPSHAIETTAYALLAQVALNDMQYSIPIVNWLNSVRLAAGSFPSTQDTVIALHALSEYQIRTQSPEIDLHCNVTYSNDKTLSRTLRFQNDNVDVLQQFELEKIGGTVFFRTSGKGVGSLSVTLRYNVPHPMEKLCKFNVTVTVSEAKPEVKPAVLNKKVQDDFFIPDGLIRALQLDYNDYHDGFREDNDIQNNVVPDRIVPQNKAIGRDKDFDKRDSDDEDERNKAGIDIDENEEERGKAGVGELQKANSKIVLQVHICASYLSNKTTDMAIIDAGIFSGFKPDIEDLKKLIESENIESFEMAGRSIIFYLKNIPFGKPVCLKFRITREFIVGAVQPSVIKVYDYYNVDEACTVFYSPDSNSPLLKTICEGPVCQCAEGGCPHKEPFGHILELHKLRAYVLLEACEKHDYVWKGIVESMFKKDGFFHIIFRINNVLKPGAEQKNHIEGITKTLLLQDTCTSFELIDNQEYLIMGNDGERFEDRETRELQYRYLIDKTTIIHRWVLIRQAPNKVLQKALNWLETQLNTEDACKS